MNDLPVSIRLANSDDLGYVIATWSRDYHKVHPINFIPNNIYIPNQTKLINNIISKTQIYVACIEDEPNTIVGYMVAKPYDKDNIILHWMNVKGIFRRVGVAKILLSTFDYNNKNIICSHYFDLFKKLKDRYNLVYDPTLLEEFR